MSTFPPVADYAFLSNCEQSCLVAPDGSVEWLCLPRPDSPSVFGALLDRTAGEFRFGPTSAQVPHHRRYVPGTMVLETTWHTPTGWLVVHDLLVMGRTDVSHRRADYRRAPTDFGATGRLESQGPPVLAASADLGEFHLAPRLLGRPRAAPRDLSAGQ